MSRSRNRDVSANEPSRVRHGRRAPYTQLGDWVMLSAARPQAVRLYHALSAHLTVRDEEDPDGEKMVNPTLEMLGEMLGYKNPEKLKPFFQDLVDIGAIDLELEPVPGEGGRKRYAYTIHQSPPDDYDGFESLGEFYRHFRAKKAAERATRQATRLAAAKAKAEAAAEAENASDSTNSGPAPEGKSAGFPIPPNGGVEPIPPNGGVEPIPPNGGVAIENKTLEQDEENKSRGRTAAPRTPAGKNPRACATSLPTDQRNQQGDLTTACAERGVVDDSSETANSESASSEWTPPVGAVIGGDGAQLEYPSSRQAALAAAAEARARGTVRSKARKSVPDLPRRAAQRSGTHSPIPAGFDAQRANQAAKRTNGE